MRGLTKLYICTCESIGCLSNSDLVRYFTDLDHMDDAESAYPTCLDLRYNYLGDAGAAACFYLLPYMLWVRRVEASNIGCGPLAIKALCSVLALRTARVIKKEVGLTYPSLPVASESNETDNLTKPSVEIAAPVERAEEENRDGAMAVVPLEYIDLTGNPIFAHAAEELVKALRLRRDWVRRCHRDRAMCATMPAHLKLVLDWKALPNRIAVRLQALCANPLESSPALPSGICSLKSPRLDKTNTIYRILTSIRPADSDTIGLHSLHWDTTNPFLTSFVQKINERIEDYILVSYYFKPHAIQTKYVDETWSGAAYLCAEYGLDLISTLFNQPDCATGGIATGFFISPPNLQGGVRCNQIVDRVRVLLRALDTAPQLLIEALERDRDGPLLHYYLDRLRTLFSELTSHPQSSPSHFVSSKFADDLIILYHRVVSSLVCRKMEWTLLPVIERSEARIEEVKEYMVKYLLDGERASSSHGDFLGEHEMNDKEIFCCGALTRWCAQGVYHIYNERKSHAKWNCTCQSAIEQLYKTDLSSTSRMHESCESSVCFSPNAQGVTHPQASNCTQSDPGQGVVHLKQDTTHSGARLAEPLQQVKAGDVETMPFPSHRDCESALRTFYGALQDPYTAKRLEVVAPLQEALPVEMRRFLLELFISKSSSSVSGSPYVAGLFGQPSSLEALVNLSQVGVTPETTLSSIEVRGTFCMPGWSLVDILSVLYNRRDRLMELLNAFTEWYRLRTIESLASGV